MEPWKLEPARDLELPLIEQLRSPRRETGFLSSIARRGWWLTTRTYLSIWHRLTVVHPENLPRQVPFVLVANHGSHLDALTLNSALPVGLVDRVFPLAAGDVFFQSPFAVAFAASFLNALPVWRQRRGGKSFQALRQRLLDEACGFILFPEGTRSRDGKMSPFRAGIGMLVAGTPVPVVPCHLSGCFEALPPGRRFPRRRAVRLTVGRAIRFDEVSDEKSGWEAIAERMEAAVRELRGE